MALLKAFVCQVILLGLYKLFLEQVVEEHLVPDELTRNCFVGFVCLLCFGIQLYTDKAGDEDNAEADESPKSESREDKSAKSLNGKQVGDSISPIEAENVTEVGHSGISVQFSPYMRNAVPNVKASGMGEPEEPASTARTSYDQEMTNIPVLSGFSERIVCEESDEDDIEIDKFVANESAKDEVEQLRTVKTEEVEAIIPEDVTETVVESESLVVNGEDLSPAQDTNTTTTLDIDQSSEAEVTNSMAEESLPSAQEMSSASSPSTKIMNNVETMNNDNGKISTPVKTAMSPPSEALTVSTVRQNAMRAGDVCFPPVTIDISFIYACH